MRVIPTRQSQKVDLCTSVIELTLNRIEWLSMSVKSISQSDIKSESHPTCVIVLEGAKGHCVIEFTPSAGLV